MVKSEIFKELIATLSGVIKNAGFTKSGNEFYLSGPDNTGIFAFQSSQKSTADEIFFTINFGVFSKDLARLVDGRKDIAKPKVIDCQWAARVGDFLPGSPDYWWNLNGRATFDLIQNDVADKIDKVVFPELGKRLTTEQLISEWVNGRHAGNTEYMRFVYLTTLLKATGKDATLNQFIEDFLLTVKGRPLEKKAKLHLNEIGFHDE